MLRALSQFFEGYKELHDRRNLALQPWRSEHLHWHGEKLVGRYNAPATRPAVTAGGWCPCPREHDRR